MADKCWIGGVLDGLAGGFLVTSGDFTDEARRFADGREVVLINGQSLQKGMAGASGAARRGAMGAPDRVV